jgi:hypothetical protein
MMKFRVFWDVALCSHEVDQRFRGVYASIIIITIIVALMMEAVRTSETVK